MANKTPRKTITKKPAPKRKAPVKRLTSKPKAKPAPKTTAKGKGSTSRKISPIIKSVPSGKEPLSKPTPALVELSLDRQLDILGVVFLLIGGLTLLFLASSNRSTASDLWVKALTRVFGWGGYVLPLGLVVVGLWLIFRRFDKVPQLEAERAVGIGVLFFNLVTWLHFFVLPETRVLSQAMALDGRGGGYLGELIAWHLNQGLGTWGTVIVLLAWMLIGLMLMLDTTVADLFKWMTPVGALIVEILKMLGRQIAKGWNWLMALIWSKKAAIESIQVSEESPLDLPSTDILPVIVAGEHKDWILPIVEQVLNKGEDVNFDDDYDRTRAKLIEDTLRSFGAPAQVVEVNRGPTITQFGVEPGFLVNRSGKKTRVRVNKISSLADDMALALAAQRIRIQAPVPGKGYIGIEVPNERVALVSLRDVIETESFQYKKSPLSLALGQNVAGEAISARLESMPHLLIAGATGSGKSVCVNSVIATFLLNNTPDELRMIMVDPKRVELTNYNGIPHLLAPVVVEMDRVVGALQWVTREMDSRYQKFSDTNTRNIDGYNELMVKKGTAKLPLLVVIIDELADLMMLAPDQTEKSITRLAQLARATGIHLIIATQRPSVDVVTGLIKANFPARIAFAVSSGVDSRVILDQPGAERLLGSGDMLFQAPDAPAPVRLQGVFVSDEEINRLVHFWRLQSGAVGQHSMHTDVPADAVPRGIPLKQKAIWEDMVEQEDVDPLYEEALDMIRRQDRASISMLQRKMRIGYTRAAKLIERMEAKGIIGPPEGGAHSREILDYGPAGKPAEDR